MAAISTRLPDDDLLSRVLANYGVTSAKEADRSAFVDKHIVLLETSDKEAVARSGFVLRRASEGFGLGYKVPLAIVAMGQVMLGLDLAVATPFLAANPAAFTCAAIGAVYYGYAALDDSERLSLQQAVGQAIGAGIELVRSVVDFCIGTLKSLFDKETLSEIRDLVAHYALQAGSSLADVTGKISDRAWEFGKQAAFGVESLASSAADTVSAAWTNGSARFRSGQGEKK